MERQLFFPTAVYSKSMPNAPELNKYLIKHIKQWKKEDSKGVIKTNQGGWHSPTTMHQRKEFKPLVDELLRMITDVSTEECYTRPLMLNNMWANINYRGCYNRDHIHSNAQFSGCYYIQTPEECGELYILDPRHGANMLMPNQHPVEKIPERLWKRINYTPTAGRIIMFPGYLFHGVNPNFNKKKGEGSWRISISFNCLQEHIDDNF